MRGRLHRRVDAGPQGFRPSRELVAGLGAAVAGVGIVGATIVVEIVGPPGPPIFGWEQLSALIVGTLLLGGGLADILYRSGRRPEAELATQPLFVSAVAASGAALVAAGVLLDRIGLAGYSGLGWKQAAAVGIGAATLGAAGRLGWKRLSLERGTDPGASASPSDSAAEERPSVPMGARFAEYRWPQATRIGFRLIVAAYAAFLAIRHQAEILLDDAAISFRYVERLTTGLGFTYNDHERVLGASNPLYTLILAGLDLVGLDPESAARVFGVVAFVGIALLAFDLAERLSNPVGGLVAALALSTDTHFRDMALSGMESGLAALLGLGAIAALLRRRDVLAGVLLGLAIWNKLDAGLLAGRPLSGPPSRAKWTLTR